jgi:hypothetical protein
MPSGSTPWCHYDSFPRVMAGHLTLPTAFVALSNVCSILHIYVYRIGCDVLFWKDLSSRSDFWTHGANSDSSITKGLSHREIKTLEGPL